MACCGKKVNRAHADRKAATATTKAKTVAKTTAALDQKAKAEKVKAAKTAAPVKAAPVKAPTPASPSAPVTNKDTNARMAEYARTLRAQQQAKRR